MSKYAGTQTEKNLMEAFAGESQARNKYTYFASKAKKEGFEQIAEIFRRPPTTRRSMRNSGLRNWKVLAIPLRTFCTQLKVRTMSGQICMKVLQRPLRRRVSRLWP